MSTYVVGRDVQALVVDIGSFSTKIGYAGDDHPQAIYNSTTAVERNNNKNNASTTTTNSSFRSNFSRPPKRDFATRCVDGPDGDGRYELVNPVDPTTGWLFSPPSRSCSMSSNDDGGDDDGSDDGRRPGGGGDAWESHELVNRYLQHAFQHALGLGGTGSSGSGKQRRPQHSTSLDYACHHPLLLLDKPHTPPAIRQRLLEIMFETHDLPAVFFLRDAIASCYAVGRTTATVVDVGYSSTMVTPVYEGFVETRGVLRNNACGARAAEERVLRMMDGIVKKQGGRRRKDRMRRTNQRRLEKEKEGSSGGSGSSNNANAGSASAASGNAEQQQNNSPPRRTAIKRDAAGHFVKESSSSSLAPIPEYLMPLYQVRRAPSYTPRSAPFHHWSRLALAREIKEMGLGVAVGPPGYVSTESSAGIAANAGAEGANAASDSINPATANSAFLASSKLPYALPDGTAVEITTASRCDVAEVYFGNDEHNVNERERVLDETMAALEEYENEIEEFVAAEREDEEENDEARRRGPTAGVVGGGNGGAAAGDPYSNTSYRGEKSSRAGARGRGGRRTYHSPNTISTKLYSACLPYVRTAPPNAGAGAPDSAGASSVGGSVSAAAGVDDDYFHYLTSAPPAQMVCDAAFRCDRDQQASLLGNVVVCGGGSCITGAAGAGSGVPGALGTAANAAAGGGGVMAASPLGDEHAFPDRLREEVEGIVHRHTPGWRVKVSSPNISERAICSWLGGSILGSLGTFQDMWISKRDYEEFGAAIVNRKCP